jgi:hypothetical protein
MSEAYQVGYEMLVVLPGFGLMARIIHVGTSIRNASAKNIA